MYNRSHSNKIYRAGLVETARREYRHTSSSLLIRYQVPVGMSERVPSAFDGSIMGIIKVFLHTPPPPLRPCHNSTSSVRLECC